MNEIVAFVVGIENYAHPGWDVPGPCRSAVDITRHLRSIGAKPENIFLFTNQAQGSAPGETQQALAKFAEEGIKITAPTYYNIENAFGRLLDHWPGDSRLFFYWSGHGFVAKSGDRIFACHDYDSNRSTAWVFNAKHRLARLHSSQFKNFSQQIFLADVCGQYSKLKFGRDEQPYDDRLKAIRQVAFFATPEGEYAKGAFTEVAIGVLQIIPGCRMSEHFPAR